MQNYTTCGISFSKDILSKIDTERGLIPRSIFLRKILEQTYADNKVNENAIGSEPTLLQGLTHSVSTTTGARLQWMISVQALPAYKNSAFVERAADIITKLCVQMDKCCPDCREIIKDILKI